IALAPGGIVIRADGWMEGAPAEISFHAARDGSRPRLTIALNDGRGIDITADDLGQMLQKHPALVRPFLAPVLTEIAGANLLRPRAGDVYRVFDEILPTVEEQRALAAILPQLDDEDRSVREAAARRLEQLGPSGVLVALRMDFSRLSPEQAARLADFVRRHSLGEIDPAVARADLSFLRLAAEDADPRVREAARDQIERLMD
ncbi:MAG: hypothetical protein NZ561_06345, partial [Phycisphaerae bacterium]|nr:hypothetical protein [Phycisphaerae bacterium]